MRRQFFILACLWSLLPLQALGENLVIPTDPARVDIPGVKFYRFSYGLQEDETGRFQLQVNVRYRRWTSQVEHVTHVVFRLQSGQIVQRDDQTLSLHLNNREMVVGQHRWWYDPYWQATNGVRIACDSKRQFRSLRIENCRLIVGKPVLDAKNRPAYPVAEGATFTREAIATIGFGQGRSARPLNRLSVRP